MKIAVIGAGSWGTAISGVAAAKADEVMLWSHDEPVPPSINERHLNQLYLTASGKRQRHLLLRGGACRSCGGNRCGSLALHTRHDSFRRTLRRR